MAHGRVFISYRRGRDNHAAGRLHDRLERVFGNEHLFYDIDSIPPGVDFHEHLDQQVAACDAFLVVIGPGWLADVGRLQDEDDFVRVEIASALRRERIRIIPVLLQGAHMPKRTDLPDALHALARRNSVTVPDDHFAAVVDGRIASAIRETLGMDSAGNRRPMESPESAEAVSQSADASGAGETGSDPPDREDVLRRPSNADDAPVKAARVFVRESLRLERLVSHVTGVAFSPDGRRLGITSFEHEAKVLDAATGAEVARLKGHGSLLLGVAFSADGRLLAAASADKTALLWDVAKQVRVARFKGHDDYVQSVAFSPDGRQLATGASDRTVRLWDIASGAETGRFEGHTEQVRSVVFAPDGALVASGADDGTVRLWDVATRAQVALLEAGRGGVFGVAFSPDGHQLATASGDHMLRLWNVATRAMETRLEGHEDAVWAVAYSPDGRYLATGSDDTTARLWDRAAGAEIGKMQVTPSKLLGWTIGGKATSVAFSPGGARLAAGDSEGTLWVWELSRAP